MWSDLLAALGLMLVMEGIMPFLNPRRVRELMRQISDMDERVLRVFGVVAMVIGLGLLYLVRWQRG